jgi:hypothetical protein
VKSGAQKMSDYPTKNMLDGVVSLDVGCFRQKTPKEMAEETSREYLEAAIKRILDEGPPTRQGKGNLR